MENENKTIPLKKDEQVKNESFERVLKEKETLLNGFKEAVDKFLQTTFEEKDEIAQAEISFVGQSSENYLKVMRDRLNSIMFPSSFFVDVQETDALQEGKAVLLISTANGQGAKTQEDAKEPNS